MRTILFGALVSVVMPVYSADLPDVLLWNGDAQDMGDPKPLKGRVYPLAKNEAIVVKFDKRCVAAVKFTETARNSVIEDDIAALTKKILKASGDRKDNDPCPKELDKRKLTGTASHVPKFDRSTIKVVAMSTAEAEIAGQTIYYGPEEHLSLGIDLPVNNRKVLKYDETSQSLQPKDDAPQVYLSLNYTIGDLLEAPSGLKNRLSVKVMARASRRPLDSYGVGIGVKLDGMMPLGVELKGFSIFGGYFRTRVDAITDGAVQVNEGSKNSWRAGISYDLGTGLKWASF